VVVVNEAVRSAPVGVRDSKLLTPAARRQLVPKLRRWAPAHAVGHAQPGEIDAYGIIAALRLAARRALAALPQTPDVIILDGSHNWLTGAPARGTGPSQDPDETDSATVETSPAYIAESLFAVDEKPPAIRRPAPEVLLAIEPAVQTMIKADLRCAAVAAASVLAKVERDALMVDLAERYPQYGWQANKGYSAVDHIDALVRHGACCEHRRSWRLPGLPGPQALPGRQGFDDVRRDATGVGAVGTRDGVDVVSVTDAVMMDATDRSITSLDGAIAQR
jgi:ribonuclease HII